MQNKQSSESNLRKMRDQKSLYSYVATQESHDQIAIIVFTFCLLEFSDNLNEEGREQIIMTHILPCVKVSICDLLLGCCWRCCCCYFHRCFIDIIVVACCDSFCCCFCHFMLLTFDSTKIFPKGLGAFSGILNAK